MCNELQSNVKNPQKRYIPIVKIVFKRQILFRIVSVVLYNDNMLDFFFQADTQNKNI